jgi:hypothetical protein
MLPHMADRRALLRKLENVEAFPLIALQALPELRADLDAVEAEALLRARELGASLEDIAEALAITRQGVAYKLKTLAGDDDHDDAGPPESVPQAKKVQEAAEPEVVEVAEVIEVSDEPEATDEAARDEVVDVRGSQSEAPPEVDFRRPHTKA